MVEALLRSGSGRAWPAAAAVACLALGAACLSAGPPLPEVAAAVDAERAVERTWSVNVAADLHQIRLRVGATENTFGSTMYVTSDVELGVRVLDPSSGDPAAPSVDLWRGSRRMSAGVGVDPMNAAESRHQVLRAEYAGPTVPLEGLASAWARLRPPELPDGEEWSPDARDVGALLFAGPGVALEPVEPMSAPFPFQVLYSVADPEWVPDATYEYGSVRAVVLERDVVDGRRRVRVGLRFWFYMHADHSERIGEAAERYGAELPRAARRPAVDVLRSVDGRATVVWEGSAAVPTYFTAVAREETTVKTLSEFDRGDALVHTSETIELRGARSVTFR